MAVDLQMWGEVLGTFTQTLASLEKQPGGTPQLGDGETAPHTNASSK